MVRPADADDTKDNVLGVLVDAVDYDTAVDRIVAAGRERRGFSVTALAVHGVMTGVTDSTHRYRLNHIDLVVPDGQPVRWALNRLHRRGLADRVYGPELMLRVCARAATDGLPIFLYGGEQATLDRLRERLTTAFPGLVIAGAEPSKFRRTTPEDKAEIAARISASGARILFIGLGCPRQEVFAYEYRDAVSMPLIAVGAAFQYHAGELREPSGWTQRHGLQWLVRLVQDPRRLWKRYVVLNPLYLTLLAAQATRLWRPTPDDARPPAHELLYG